MAAANGGRRFVSAPEFRASPKKGARGERFFSPSRYRNTGCTKTPLKPPSWPFAFAIANLARVLTSPPRRHYHRSFIHCFFRLTGNFSASFAPTDHEFTPRGFCLHFSVLSLVTRLFSTSLSKRLPPRLRNLFPPPALLFQPQTNLPHLLRIAQYNPHKMKVFSSTSSFDYSWEEVSTANWRKYCPWNEKSTHVVGVDTLSRNVDAATGIVSTM